MWLFTDIGFFSIVQDLADPPSLLVRGRSRSDLQAFLDRARPRGCKPSIIELGPEVADYRFRVSLPRTSVIAVVTRLLAGLDYANFKGAVARRQGPARAHVYLDIWNAASRIGP